jgi:hypothetical protein
MSTCESRRRGCRETGEEVEQMQGQSPASSRIAPTTPSPRKMHGARQLMCVTLSRGYREREGI